MRRWHFSEKQTKLAAMLSLSLMLTAGCQTTRTQTSETSQIASLTVADFCKAFPNISYSRTDTQETRRQIVGFNAARDALCK